MSKNIYEIPVDRITWRFLSQDNILLGMDGELYVKSTAQTWVSKKTYQFHNDRPFVPIRRKGKACWEVRLPDDGEGMTAGDPTPNPSWAWVKVEGWEPVFRPLSNGFAKLSANMQSFGASVATAGEAMGRLKIAEPLTVQQGTRRGSRVYHVDVMDQKTGERSVLVMNETRYKKLLKIGGTTLNQIITDDMNVDIQEDDTKEHLSIMSVLDNLYEPTAP